MRISQLKELQEHTKYTGNYLLNKIDTKNAVNGIYLDIELQDCTGKINAKMWQVDKNIISNYIKMVGNVVTIIGKKNTYRGKIQIIIESIAHSDDTDITRYIKRSLYDKQELKDYIDSCINKIEDKTMHKIVVYIINKYEKQFYSYPAASKNHHDYMSGLAQHTFFMLKIAGNLFKIYPHINLSYLYSGIILHDLGKVIELSGVVSTSYTLEGQLIGHINIIYGEIDVAIKELEIDTDKHKESVILLKHLVISHHGKYEYGSPKLPMFLEAEILSIIDDLDARIETLTKNLYETKEGDFTEKIFSLDNRKFYKPIGQRKE